MKKFRILIWFCALAFFSAFCGLAFANNLEINNEICDYDYSESSLLESQPTHIHLVANKTCSSCKGTGKCHSCGGTGRCKFCKGTGKLSMHGKLLDKSCSHCSRGKCSDCFYDGSGKCSYCHGDGVR